LALAVPSQALVLALGTIAMSRDLDPPAGDSESGQDRIATLASVPLANCHLMDRETESKRPPLPLKKRHPSADGPVLPIALTLVQMTSTDSPNVLKVDLETLRDIREQVRQNGDNRRVI
jgi:hypothetical protein